MADLAHELTLKTVEVEDFVDVGAPLRDVVVARVGGLEPVGGKGHLLATCETDTRGLVRIVTRAKGLSVGQLVPVALLGARLRLPGGEATAEVTRIEIASV